MTTPLHTVLGASGAIGQAVIRELNDRKLSIRGVEREAKASVETITADLLDQEQAIRAISGSSFVYLCVGLPYKTKVWLKDWPLLMTNVIAACLETNAVLVFFDNTYMYARPLQTPFDEQHIQYPPSKKGEARKWAADILFTAICEKGLKAVVGRSSDFYGPHAINSPFYISFLEKMLQKKNPTALGKSNILHTYAFSCDNGRALVALALDEATYGQVWHLPVGEPISFEDVTRMFNQALNTNYKVAYLPVYLRKFLSLFMPPLWEVSEMIYQFEYEYIMSSNKFKDYFPDFKVTSYKEGIKIMIDSFKKNED